MTVDLPKPLKQWTAKSFPALPFAYWGQSAAAMLHDALRAEKRINVVLPAFICPSISAAAIQAGKNVIHVDVDRTTLHMCPTSLDTVLCGLNSEETVLLVDHAFGYACNHISEVRRRHPGLLIIEDCVRAVGGATSDGPIGSLGDWVLVSLYKTVIGNDHGAMLLTGSPFAIRSGPARPITLRQVVSTIGPARAIYEWIKRRSFDCTPTREDLESPSWKPAIGIPNQLCLRRFLASARTDENTFQGRQETVRYLRSALGRIGGLSFIKSAQASTNAEHFLSFTVREGVERDRLIADLHRKGLFLLRTWDCVPAYFRSLHSTFPAGISESVFLAKHVVHIPVSSFLSFPKRERLVEAIQQWFLTNIDSKSSPPSPSQTQTQTLPLGDHRKSHVGTTSLKT